MEEDLEILNEVLIHHRETEKVRIAIKHLIIAYKELKEIDQIHRQDNGELRERVKELEEVNRVYHIKISNNLERIKQLEDTNKKLYEIGKEIGKQDKYTSENYISKSKVEEKIEELDRKITYIESQYTNGGQNCNSNYLSALYQKQVLQELLEERNK